MKNNTFGKLLFAAVLSAVLTASICAAGEAQLYQLDKAHSRIGFSVGHMGISTVSGQFKDYDGEIRFKAGEDGSLSAKATIQVASVDTGIEARDKHLLNEDFFDAEQHPTITYDAKAVSNDGEQWLLKGTFTMRGTKRELELPLTVKGPIEDPWGNSRIGLQGRAVINRHDYGVGSDKLSDKMVGREVTLEIALEAIAVQDE